MNPLGLESFSLAGESQTLEFKASFDKTTVKSLVVGNHGKFVQGTSKPDGTMRKIMDESHINALGRKRKMPLMEGIVLSGQDMPSKI